MSARSDAENRSPRAFGSRFEEKSRMNDAGTSDSNSPDDGKKSSAAGGLSSLLSAAASSNPTHTTVSNAIGTLFLITGPAASGKKTLFKGSFEETLHESPNYALSKRSTTKPEELCGFGEACTTEEAFKQVKDDGGFLYTYKEKGEAGTYGLQASIIDSLGHKKKVMVMVPLSAVSEIIQLPQLQPFRVKVVALSAPIEVLMLRLELTETDSKSKAIIKKLKRSMDLIADLQEQIELAAPSSTSSSSSSLSAPSSTSPLSSARGDRDNNGGKDKDSTRTPRTKVSPRVAGKENGDKTSTDSGEGASKKAGSGGDGGRGGHDATAAAEEEAGVSMQVVASQGLLEDCLSLFLDALEFDASKDLLPIDPNDLKRCSAQDYLKRTVFPFLAQGLTALDVVRPADPVAYLALHLFKHANLQRRNIAKLKAIKTVRMELRRKAKEEIAFRGRI